MFLSCLTGVLQGIEIGCLFHVKHFDRGTKREIVEVITFRLSFGNNCFTFGIMNCSTLNIKTPPESSLVDADL